MTQGPSTTRRDCAIVIITAVLLGTTIEIAHGVVMGWAVALCGSFAATHRFQSLGGTVRVICTSFRGSTRYDCLPRTRRTSPVARSRT